MKENNLSKIMKIRISRIYRYFYLFFLCIFTQYFKNKCHRISLPIKDLLSEGRFKFFSLKLINYLCTFLNELKMREKDFKRNSAIWHQKC